VHKNNLEISELDIRAFSREPDRRRDGLSYTCIRRWYGRLPNLTARLIMNIATQACIPHALECQEYDNGMPYVCTQHNGCLSVTWDGRSNSWLFALQVTDGCLSKLQLAASRQGRRPNRTSTPAVARRGFRKWWGPEGYRKLQIFDREDTAAQHVNFAWEFRQKWVFSFQFCMCLQYNFSIGQQNIEEKQLFLLGARNFNFATKSPNEVYSARIL